MGDRPKSAMGPAELRRFLQKQHAEYCHHDQAPDAQSVFMAEHGHPFALQYSRLRKLFDGLKYACNYGERYIAVKGKYDMVSYSAPRLVTNCQCPDEWARGRHLPGYPEFMDYLQAVADHGWPKSCGLELRCGSFNLVTSNRRLVEEVKGLLAPDIGVEQVEDARAWYFEYGGFCAGNYTKTVAVWRAIHKHTADFVLPRRTKEDDVVDNAPLPLPYKKFTLGYSRHVEVTDYFVLVPKIPLTPEGDQVVRQAVYDLLNLCDRGYPWQGNVREWMMMWFHAKKDLHKPNQQMLKWDRKYAKLQKGAVDNSSRCYEE
jgi:hypothetical protein